MSHIFKHFKLTTFGILVSVQITEAREVQKLNASY